MEQETGDTTKGHEEISTARALSKTVAVALPCIRSKSKQRLKYRMAEIGTGQKDREDWLKLALQKSGTDKHTMVFRSPSCTFC